MQKHYNHAEIEPKWQEKWEHAKVFVADESATKPKYYALDMFPYPSGAGLHVGHPEGYTATDIVSRYKRMCGFEVLHPMGWDAFGLPAENYAIKAGVAPQESTSKNITTFKRQIKSLGFSYDWTREVNTSSPEYYVWTQWLFLQLYKKGLAYKKKAQVNWCPTCQTVLANEQVIDGKCERSGDEVIQKELEQWFFKITDYAEQLLADLDTLDWPEPIKLMQRNWIGKSEGAEIKFNVEHSDFSITVFTTRPDTLYGATYMVLAPEHELITKLKSQITNLKEVEAYITESTRKTDLQRTDLNKDKTGIELEGIKAINPATGETIPVYVADYVLSTYGTGAIMAVPAHDERDFEFAKKYGIQIQQVVAKVIGEKKKGAKKRTGVAVIMTNTDGKILIQSSKRERGILYRLPGGGVEEGENLVEALHREIIEETGYVDFEIQECVQVFEYNYFSPEWGFDRSIIEHVYVATLLSEQRQERKLSEKEKTLELSDEWVDGHEAVRRLELFDNFIGYPEAEIVRQYLANDAVSTDAGILVNSSEFSGMDSTEAKQAITEKVGGTMKTQYRLRDWLVSRQRYWGAPIPIVYDPDGVAHPVKEEHLPLLLPTDVEYKPKGTSPLGSSKEYKELAEKLYGTGWYFEIDTMDTFVCSSWYFLRYADPQNTKVAFAKDKVGHWLPVDLYVGGAEHAVLHLLYARFFTKAFRDIGLLDFDEPFTCLRNQGMILAEDGRKMSKSLGNVINPDEVVTEYGADTMRLYEMFMGPLEDAKPWSTKSIIGVRRFLEKIWLLTAEWLENNKPANESEDTVRLLHKTVKKVTADIESMKFNTAISTLMIFTNHLAREKHFSQETVETLLKLVSPFAPHMAEELWQNIGHDDFICQMLWPQYDEAKTIDDEISLPVQVNGKMRGTVTVAMDCDEVVALTKAKELDTVQTAISQKEIIKVVYVPGKILNIVVKG